MIDKLKELWKAGHQHSREVRQALWEEDHQENLFGASTLSSCPRKCIVARKKMPVTHPHDEYTLGRFEIGAWLEDRELGILGSQCWCQGGGDLYTQVEARYKDFVAHTDAVWVFNGQSYAIEVKSIDPRAMSKRKKGSPTGYFEPYPEHLLQLAQFILLSELSGKPVEPVGLLYYVMLDGRLRFYYEVPLAPYRNELEARMMLVETHWAAGTLPPTLEEMSKPTESEEGWPTLRFGEGSIKTIREKQSKLARDDWPCKGCEFWGHCYEGERKK